MIKSLLTVTCLSAGLMLVGCDDQSSSTSTPAAPAVEDHTGHDHDGVESEVDKAAGTVKDDAAGAGASAAGEVEKAAGDAKAAMADETTQGQAQKLIDQATSYINENKFELAEKAINELDGMKGSLPEGMADQVGKLKSMLDAKKASDSATGLIGGVGQ